MTIAAPSHATRKIIFGENDNAGLAKPTSLSSDMCVLWSSNLSDSTKIGMESRTRMPAVRCRHCLFGSVPGLTA
jgi:hypothetical protein